MVLDFMHPRDHSSHGGMKAIYVKASNEQIKFLVDTRLYWISVFICDVFFLVEKLRFTGSLSTPNITFVYRELLNPELVFGYQNTDSLESV